ncbi:MAG TPA: endolytic transglycosylase MltG [Bacillus bacterium]|nr:endolytic transglycosylase MltG [Bacillus sp. (in: firmicutes)]
MANNSLRSFASGIMIATIIFTAVYYFLPSNKGKVEIVEEHVITDEEVEQYLDQKGYMSISKQTYEELTNKQEAANIVEKNAETTEQSPNNPTPNEAIEQKQDVTSGIDEDNKSIDNNPVKVTPRTYTLQITPGMSGVQIGKQLEAAKIVKSGKTFSEFLASKDWQSKIQVGTYYLSSDMTYEQIGKKITTKRK